MRAHDAEAGFALDHSYSSLLAATRSVLESFQISPPLPAWSASPYLLSSKIATATEDEWSALRLTMYCSAARVGGNADSHFLTPNRPSRLAVSILYTLAYMTIPLRYPEVHPMVTWRRHGI